MSNCDHHEFEADVKVTRLSETNGGPITGYQADVHICCKICGVPFAFIGLPMGLNLNGAAVSANRLEARLAIKPARRIDN